ncbi:MAM and LDL-receptor class A domain-containing protein 1-like [Glandiceps talaboti]
MTGRTPSSDTGPTNDHTYDDATGAYMFIETSSPRTFGDLARLRSPIMNPVNGDVCVSFWYHMYGDQINTLTVRLVKVFGTTLNQTDDSTILWRSQFDHGDQWLYAEAHFYSDVSFFVAFDGISGTGYLGDIAIDDVTIDYGLCPTLATTVGPTTATPEPVDECNRYIDNDFNQINSPNYPSNYDDFHNCSYTFSVEPNQYLAIYFDDFSIETCSQCSCDAVIIEDIRFCGDVPPGQNGTLYFVLDSTVKIRFESDSSVTQSGFHAFSVMFNKIGYTLPFACYFEVDDICGFIQYIRDDFDWIVGTGSTSTVRTGPSEDHTTGSGKYIYLESSTRDLDDHARLFSPLFHPITEPACLNFYYHMFGNTMGRLEVSLLYENSSTFGQPIFTVSEDQGDQWHNVSLDISSDEFFRFMFDGYIGSGFTSDIAIDDVTLKLGSCTPCTAGLYQCSSDGRCIPASWECDGILDCPQNEDELDCDHGTCDPSQFQCKSGQCIPGSWECDGIQDCSSNNDEAHCVYTPKP